MGRPGLLGVILSYHGRTWANLRQTYSDLGPILGLYWAVLGSYSDSDSHSQSNFDLYSHFLLNLILNVIEKRYSGRFTPTPILIYLNYGFAWEVSQTWF